MANDTNGGYPKDYLDAPDTAGRPMALVSIILTFIVIAVLAFMLFSAGKWGYDKYVNNDEQTTSEVATDEAKAPENPTSNEQSSTTSQQSGTDQSTNNTNTSSNNTNQNNTNSATSTNQNNSSSTGQSTNTNTSAESQTSQTPQTPATGPVTPTTVPNTGPQNLLAIFVITSLFGTIAYYKFAK